MEYDAADRKLIWLRCYVHVDDREVPTVFVSGSVNAITFRSLDLCIPDTFCFCPRPRFDYFISE